MKKNTKIITGYVLLFIEVLLLLIITISCILKVTVFRVSYVKNELAKNNYYEELSSEIKTEMSYYTNQSGFEDEILDNIFTIGEIKYETNLFIENIYKGKSRTIDTTKLNERLDKNINNYLAKNNFENINKKEIADFKKAMAEVYQDEIKLMGYTDKIAGVVSKIINLSNNILIISIVLFVLLFIVNHILIKNKEIGVIFFTTAFILLSISIYIKNNIDISNIFIYSKLISTSIKSIINNLFFINMIIIIIYIIFGFIISMLKKTKKSE